MMNDDKQFEKYYHEDLQGTFYADHYYRERDQEEESAIVYSDDEDKRLFSYIINDYFKLGKILEVGCAMGFLLKELVGFGYAAQGIDFSKYCLDNLHPAIARYAQWADIMELLR